MHSAARYHHGCTPSVQHPALELYTAPAKHPPPAPSTAIRCCRCCTPPGSARQAAHLRVYVQRLRCHWLVGDAQPVGRQAGKAACAGKVVPAAQRSSAASAPRPQPCTRFVREHTLPLNSHPARQTDCLLQLSSAAPPLPPPPGPPGAAHPHQHLHQRCSLHTSPAHHSSPTWLAPSTCSPRSASSRPP
jgi:hypothetical protein